MRFIYIDSGTIVFPDRNVLPNRILARYLPNEQNYCAAV